MGSPGAKIPIAEEIEDSKVPLIQLLPDQAV
jgi:hypothetical protein